MTPGYRARRETKHLAEKRLRREMNALPAPTNTIDLTVKIPRLSWLGGKSFGQGNGGRKNTPGHNTELNEALVENGSRTFAAQIKEIVEAGKALGIEPTIEEPTPCCYGNCMTEHEHTEDCTRA